MKNNLNRDLKYNLNKLTLTKAIILFNGVILGGLYRIGVNYVSSQNSLSYLFLNNICNIFLNNKIQSSCFNLYTLFLIIATFLSILFIFDKIHKKHIDSIYTELLFFIGFILGVIIFGIF